MGTFTRHSTSSPLFYYNGDSGGGFVGFYQTVEQSGGDTTISDAWNERVGFFVFLNRTLDEAQRGSFATALGDHLNENPLSIDHTSFLWLTYTTTVSRVAHVLATTQQNTPPEEDEIVVVSEVLIPFGGYRIPIDKDMEILEQEFDTEPYWFTFLYPDAPSPKCPDVAPAIPDPAHSLYLCLCGPKARSWEGTAIIGDYCSDLATSWDVALCYSTDIGGTRVHQRYPVFDLFDGRTPMLWMCWDPLDALNPERTYLEFMGFCIRLDQDPAAPGQACRYVIGSVDHPEIIPTYFRTVTGESIGFIATTSGARRSKLVFERYDTEENAAVQRYYLTFAGEFEMVLIEIVTEEVLGVEVKWLRLLDVFNAEAEIPSRFLGGLAGVESVEFMPQMPCCAGDRISFYPHKPAFAPEFPIITATPGVGALANGDVDLELLKSTFQTAWVAFVPAIAANAIYYAQPEDGPLYRPAGGPLLGLFEPPASYLPAAAPEYCFPLTPLAGALPTTVPLAERPNFLKKFEYQIVGPWRRDVIRRFPLAPVAPDPGDSVLAATPQGVLATIDGFDWQFVQLAHNTAGTDLSFCGVNRTLQAALQTNQLFMVATVPAHLNNAETVFTSTVKMGDWTFDLDVAKNRFGEIAIDNQDLDDFRDLNNALIFKFSPGSIADRVGKPKSWTNASSFDRFGETKLKTLAERLAAFMARSNTLATAPGAHEGYKRFKRIVDDPNWNGVLALNVNVDGSNIPPELEVLMAGVDPERFVARFIAVEVTSVQMGANQVPTAADCSVYGFIDYNKPGGAVAGPDDSFAFAVTQFRVWFDNGVMKDFRCTAELLIKKLFEETVTNPAPGNKITMYGNREERDGVASYSFTLDGNNRTFTLESNVLTSVEVRKTDFITAKGPDPDFAGEVALRSTFAMTGGLVFKKMMGDGAPHFDPFTYSRLAFEGLALEMKFPVANPANRKYDFATARMAFDLAPASTTMRDGGLVRRFPMRMHGLRRTKLDKLPTSEGYVALTTPLASTDALNEGLEASKHWYGLEFDLDLGTLGEFAANAGLITRMMLSWSPGIDKKRVKFWLKFPGMSGPADSLFTLQGVARFGADAYELKSYGADAATSYVLMLKSIALRILGIALPRENQPNVFIFGNPAAAAATPDDKLGWLGVYRKPQQ